MMRGAIRTPFDARSTADDVVRGVDLSGKTFIVTGGASGIGAETVRALAGAGADVTIATRDASKAERLLREISERPTAGRVRVDEIDLGDLRSVEGFTDRWQGPIDGLVANAGVMAIPERRLTAQGWEMQLATNFLGHFAMLQGLHGWLREAGHARVVTVSSTAQLRSPFRFDDPQFDDRPYDRWAAYAQSKTADVLLAVGVSRRWEMDGITANSLMPGWITTDLQRHLDDATLRSMGAMDEDGNRIEQAYFKTPAQGAATSVLLAASPLLDGVTGRYFEDNQEAPVVTDGEGHTSGVARHALDPDAAERLWRLASAAMDA
jgi:NAD(P)-dependent dehydrogenase (short-subunit alcohol dehydrogenase family)